MNAGNSIRNQYESQLKQAGNLNPDPGFAHKEDAHTKEHQKQQIPEFFRERIIPEERIVLNPVKQEEAEWKNLVLQQEEKKILSTIDSPLFEAKKAGKDQRIIRNPGTNLDAVYRKNQSDQKMTEHHSISEKKLPGSSAADMTLHQVSRLQEQMTNIQPEEDADENAAAEAAAAGARISIDAGRVVLRHASQIDRQTIQPEESALRFESDQEIPEIAISNAGSIQKRQIKKEYAKAVHDTGREGVSAAQEVIGERASLLRRLGNGIRTSARKLSGVVAVLCFAGMAVMLFLTSTGVLGSIITEAGEAVVETTYLSSDDDILAANDRYVQLEKALQNQVDTIETAYPGFDEYRYRVDEITHDPYALTSYLTARYGNYTFAQISGELQALFRNQFSIRVYDELEIRVKEAESGEESAGESEETVEPETYEWHVLNIEVTNHGLDHVVQTLMNEDQTKMYRIYQTTLGNRSYLFGDAITVGNPSGGGLPYEIPPEMLSDEQFANMIREAEKYLGYPYVWGGSSPDESFDCSGFVCWVINHCGNGWNVGRTTADGLRNQCRIVSAADAKPGDLIFFQGTYNTTGASHVGIYVGNGMMIHCGNPVQYTTIGSDYWQNHFYGFGRLS